MDSVTQLALFTKAQLVFQSPGTFLSFPALEPLSYPPDQLDFSQLANLSGPVYPEFCRLVDTVPQGVLYTAESGTPFSSEYDKVLRDAQTAQSTLTAAETAALQQALAFLFFPPILLRPPVIPVVPVRPVTPVAPVRPLPGPLPKPMPEPRPEPFAVTVARPAALPVLSPVTVGRLNTGTFTMLPIDPVLSPPAPSGAEPPPAPAGGQPPSGDVSVLAFICTALPRCPNMDPTLTW